MGKVITFPGHKQHKCAPTCEGCMFCEGGLYACVVCGGGEGTLTTDCPGYFVCDDLALAVYGGHCDYRWREGWVEKSNCEVRYK